MKRRPGRQAGAGGGTGGWGRWARWGVTLGVMAGAVMLAGAAEDAAGSSGGAPRAGVQETEKPEQTLRRVQRELERLVGERTVWLRSEAAFRKQVEALERDLAAARKAGEQHEQAQKELRRSLAAAQAERAEAVRTAGRDLASVSNALIEVRGDWAEDVRRREAAMTAAAGRIRMLEAERDKASAAAADVEKRLAAAERQNREAAQQAATDRATLVERCRELADDQTRSTQTIADLRKRLSEQAAQAAGLEKRLADEKDVRAKAERLDACETALAKARESLKDSEQKREVLARTGEQAARQVEELTARLADVQERLAGRASAHEAVTRKLEEQTAAWARGMEEEREKARVAGTRAAESAKQVAVLTERLAAAEKARGLTETALKEAAARMDVLSGQVSGVNREKTELQLALATLRKKADADVAASRAELQQMRADLDRARAELRNENLVRQGQAVREEISDPNDVALAWSLNDVALMMAREGRPADAAPLYRRALTLMEQKVGRKHPAVGTILSHLGEACWAQGDLEGACGCCREAVEVFEGTLGAGHPRLAAALNGWASVLRANRKNEEAEKHYRRAIAIYEREANRKSTDIAAPLHNLGLLLASEERYPEAGPLLERALRVLEADPQAGAMRKTVVLRSLARYYTAAGDPARAVQCEEKAAALAAGHLTESSAPATGP